MKKRQWILEEYKPKSIVSGDVRWLVIDKLTGDIIGYYFNGEDFDYNEESEECISVKLI